MPRLPAEPYLSVFAIVCGENYRLPARASRDQ